MVNAIEGLARMDEGTQDRCGLLVITKVPVYEVKHLD